MNKIRGAWLAALATIALIPCSVLGQAVYGSIYGTITDSTGALIPNAPVVVTDTAKGTTVTVAANSSGEFRVEHLIPDSYSVSVDQPGFKKYEQNNIQVFADSSVDVPVALSVGTAGEVVTVNAASVPQLKTDRADVATTYTAQEIEQLPIPDHNFTNLQLLLPGAVQLGWSHAASENPQGSKQIQIDGQAFGGVNYTLDGTDNQDPFSALSLSILTTSPCLRPRSPPKISTRSSGRLPPRCKQFRQSRAPMSSTELSSTIVKAMPIWRVTRLPCQKRLVTRADSRTNLAVPWAAQSSGTEHSSLLTTRVCGRSRELPDSVPYHRCWPCRVAPARPPRRMERPAATSANTWPFPDTSCMTTRRERPYRTRTMSFRWIAWRRKR